jgi:GntR family transcriptional regulator
MAASDSLTARTTSQLRALVRSGAFPDGRLAPEPTIARMLGVSRATVRQSLAELAHDGVLIRKHGSGTYVNPNILQMPTRLEEVWDFAEMIRLSGHAPGVQPAGQDLVPANAEYQHKLSLSAGDEVLVVTNIFLADERPVIFCRDVIPGKLVRQAYQPAELQGPVYTFLEHRCGQRVSYNITEVLVVNADRPLAAALKCRAGAALHYFDEIGYNAQHQPIIYSQEYYRSDAFSFKLVRKMTTASP